MQTLGYVILGNDTEADTSVWRLTPTRIKRRSWNNKHTFIERLFRNNLERVALWRFRRRRQVQLQPEKHA